MGKIAFLLYFLFLLGFTIFSYVFVDQNLFYLKPFYTGFYSINRQVTTIFYISSILLFFTFYIFFIWRLRKIINAFDTKLLIAATSIILFFSYPGMLSFDIFNYVASAKVTFGYHENPYIMMPIEFLGDPLLLFTHAANKIALYGPFWIGLTSIPYLLGFGNFILTLFNFKFLILVFYIATLAMIHKISKNNFSVLLLALNPLIVIETLVNSHNDIVMMFFALFSFFLLKSKKIFLSVLSLTLSILIKYATIFLIPVFVYVIWKTIRKQRQKINWDKAFIFSSLSMMIIFLLSSLREEIYPWYAIWFLSFVALVPNIKILLLSSLAFSFGLLFRHVPFMLLGTHFGVTPAIKTLVTFIPVFIILVYAKFSKVFR